MFTFVNLNNFCFSVELFSINNTSAKPIIKKLFNIKKVKKVFTCWSALTNPCFQATKKSAPSKNKKKENKITFVFSVFKFILNKNKNKKFNIANIKLDNPAINIILVYT